MYLTPRKRLKRSCLYGRLIKDGGEKTRKGNIYEEEKDFVFGN
jgi:hypothetical protein